MARSVLALVAALLTFLLLTRAAGWIAPGAFGGPAAHPATTLALGAMAGVAAGYVAGALGGGRPVVHALGAAVVLAALSFYVVPRPTDSAQPRWYPYALTAVGSAAMLAGGALRTRYPARPVVA